VDVKKAMTIVPCPFQSSFSLRPRLFFLPPCGRRGQVPGALKHHEEAFFVLVRHSRVVHLHRYRWPLRGRLAATVTSNKWQQNDK
jgi:hypothetical protein